MEENLRCDWCGAEIQGENLGFNIHEEGSGFYGQRGFFSLRRM